MENELIKKQMTEAEKYLSKLNCVYCNSKLAKRFKEICNYEIIINNSLDDETWYFSEGKINE